MWEKQNKLADAACPDPIYARLIRDGRLRVAAVDVAPQSFRSPAAPGWLGFDADLFRLFADHLGVKVEPLWSSVSEIVDHVLQGRAEMGTGLFWSAERATKIRFTVPYKWIRDHVVIRRTDDHLGSWAAFRARAIGVAAGTAEAAAAAELQRAGLVGAIKTFPTLEAAYRALEQGDVDGLINKTQFHLFRERTETTPTTRLAFEVEPRFFGRIGPSSSHLVVALHATSLAVAADRFIKGLVTSGRIASIFGTYGIAAAEFGP